MPKLGISLGLAKEVTKPKGSTSPASPATALAFLGQLLTFNSQILTYTPPQ